MKTRVEDIVVKEVKAFGETGHVTVAKKHVGKTAYVLIGRFSEPKTEELLAAVQKLAESLEKRISSLEVQK